MHKKYVFISNGNVFLIYSFQGLTKHDGYTRYCFNGCPYCTSLLSDWLTELCKWPRRAFFLWSRAYRRSVSAGPHRCAFRAAESFPRPPHPTPRHTLVHTWLFTLDLLQISTAWKMWRDRDYVCTGFSAVSVYTPCWTHPCFFLQCCLDHEILLITDESTVSLIPRSRCVTLKSFLVSQTKGHFFTFSRDSVRHTDLRSIFFFI